MKCELLYDYIKDKHDSVIIIYLDGFDTIINLDPQKAIDIFKNQNKKILFSVDGDNTRWPWRFVYNRAYGHDNTAHINCGMYMGYVKYLKIILKEMMESRHTDDQKAAIQLYSKYDFMGVDTDEMIFRNKVRKISRTATREDPVFVSFPGSMHPNRMYRSILEYSQYFLDIYIIILVILFVMLLKYKKYTYLIIILAICVFIFGKMDKSNLNM